MTKPKCDYSYRTIIDQRVKRSITKNDIINICNDIRISLENKYGENYELSPSNYNEGGIEYITWPNKSEGQHRSIRFLRNENWKPVENELSWIDSEEIVIRGGHRIEVLFKTLNGALKSRPVEIKIIKEILLSNGF